MNSSFIIVTCIFGIIGWIITLIGLCVSHKMAHALSWWIIVFELLVILITSIVIWTNTVKVYHPIILCLIAISFPYCTNEVFYYASAGKSSLATISAGYSILMIIQFIWILLFGVQYEASSILPSTFNHNIICHQKEFNNNNGNNLTFSDITSHNSMNNNNTVVLHENINYPIPVVALHNYQANKEDPTELSFNKGEVIYVHDKRGSWWQAKKSNGEIGMIPSNYVKDQLSI